MPAARESPRSAKDWAAAFALAAVYFAAGKLGLRLASVNPSATPVWPPTGIALASFLVLGYKIWPGIFAGAFLTNITTAGTIATSLGIAAGNTLEGLLGAYLVNRFASGRRFFERPQDVFKFAVLAAAVSPAASASFGVASLKLGGLVSLDHAAGVWLTWWLGDAGGALAVAPLLVIWSTLPMPRLGRRRLVQALLLFLLLGAAGECIFGGFMPGALRNAPLAFPLIPILVWIAFLFGPREAATASFALAGLAILDAAAST